jgi:16S rRNA (cytidine1402-2'-O)-methyltransferase
MAAVFGSKRPALIARELTKLFEQSHRDSLAGLSDWLEADAQRSRGEFVIVVQGAADDTLDDNAEARRLLDVLRAELPLKQAVALTAKFTGMKKNALYAMALREP